MKRRRIKYTGRRRKVFPDCLTVQGGRRMRHVFERNRARGTGLFTRRVIAAVATVAMLAGVGCVTASSAAAEDATGALEQQIEQPVLQESGQEDSQPVEQNLMVGEEQPSEQEQPSDQEAYQQVEQETEQETKEETEQWVEQEVEQQSEQPDEQPVTLSAQPIARANRAQSVAQNETGSSWALRRSISASRRTIMAVTP